MDNGQVVDLGVHKSPTWGELERWKRKAEKYAAEIERQNVLLRAQDANLTDLRRAIAVLQKMYPADLKRIMPGRIDHR